MELPTLLLSNGVLFPHGKLRIPVRAKINIEMLDKYIVNQSAAGKTMIFIAYQVDNAKKVFPFGTIAVVEQITYWQYNSHVQYRVHVEGVARAKIEKLGIPLSIVKQVFDEPSDLKPKVIEQLDANCQKMMAYLTRENTEAAYKLQTLIKEKKYDSMSDFIIAFISGLSMEFQLEFLENLSVEKRVDIINTELNRMFKNFSATSGEVKTQALLPMQNFRKIISRSPHSNTKQDEVEEKLDQANLPQHIREKIEQDVERYKNLNSGSQEYHVLRSYLELVAALPWSNSTSDKIDITKAHVELEASHYGMSNIKNRLLEYLAVKQLNDNLNGPILCLSGPPGIGKTSIAKAIAKALGRKFERLSLGGIRDESDIRGHRRTYVGAMHGRIIQALKHAQSNNPVILLDEVDKLYAGNSGSPAAALLEVLDPEQNHSFVDHYLNLPFDLSKVLFIATANDNSTIDGPLLDRMEMIEMTGYSTPDKINIAKNHIVERQLKQHGLTSDCLEFNEAAFLQIIEGYTRESGVRQLERHIASICRRAALRVAEAMNFDCTADSINEFELPIIVNHTMVRDILGVEKFSRFDLIAQQKSFRPGVCFGLAWTPFGGELMLIETSTAKGKGDVIMTGKLGDVLQESVKVARSWLKANAKRLNCSMPDDADIHVHLPAGAVGKDGPSAGCALVLALFSLGSKRMVRNDAAVTGEISLTGNVLPVGGIKEKVIGAHRAGLRVVTLPAANKSHYDDIDKNIKKDMHVNFVSTLDELLQLMMLPEVEYFSKL